MYENGSVGTLGAVAVGAGAGTLPVTGVGSLLLTLAAITVIAAGFVMLSLSLRARRRLMRASRA